MRSEGGALAPPNKGDPKSTYTRCRCLVHHAIVLMLFTDRDPNVARYVERRESLGFPAVGSGTTYDIISKICDHELAEVITNKMRKHTKDKEKEKEKEEDKEKEEENAPPQSSPKHTSHPENFRARQSLGEYYISHTQNSQQPAQKETEEEVLPPQPHKKVAPRFVSFILTIV